MNYDAVNGVCQKTGKGGENTLLTLRDFKNPGIDDLLNDLRKAEKYANACNILTKIKAYTYDELRSETGTVSVLLEMLTEYLRCDVQFASAGTIAYLNCFKSNLKALPLYNLTMCELLRYQDMIEKIEKLSVSGAHYVRRYVPRPYRSRKSVG